MVFPGKPLQDGLQLKTPHSSSQGAYLGYRIFPVGWRIVHVHESSLLSFESEDAFVRIVVNLDDQAIALSSLSCSLEPLHYVVLDRGIRAIEPDGAGTLIVIALDSLPPLPDRMESIGKILPVPAAAESLVRSLAEESDEVPRSQLVRALTELLSPSLPEGIEGEELSRFRCYVSRHLGKQISTETIASDLGMSIDRLRSVTGESIGMTPAAYLREERNRLARDLLATTTISIEMIAEQTGYSDRFAFTRAFTAATGVSPNAFRESMDTKNAVS